MSTYTKIKTLPLSLFNNAEYLSFMNHVLDLANGNSGDGDSESPDEISLLTDSDGIPELGLTKEFLDTYEADLLAMADVVDESRTSQETEQMTLHDTNRDNLAIYIITRISRAGTLPLEAERDAGKYLYKVIKPYIGYPEELPARYKDKVVDETANLFENALAFARVEIKHSWSKWNQPVDYKEWGMPAHMVNAYYNPQKNLIVFPAAILQAPFYDLHQSSSANYGGIGAVIAHEISHAFDTNGASFDENGSLKDWWTENDYAAFKEKTQKVIDQFDGQESYGARINGKLTVSENVADLGGIAAALEAAKREPDFSAEEFFHNFARIWRMKGRPELMKLMASVDVHAPAKLRVNVQVPNFDDFFTTYDVKEGDGMWRSPEDRVIIW